jgi:hypothetical protein
VPPAGTGDRVDTVSAFKESADGQRDGDAMGEAVVGVGEDGLEDPQAERAAG